MIVDERLVTYINSLDTGKHTNFRRDREGGTCLLCSDYPKGDAELFKGSVVHKSVLSGF